MDNDFDDDDFDELNATTLQELENNAIHFTQAQKKYEPSQIQEEYEDEDLDDAVILDEARGKSFTAIPPEYQAQASASRTVPRQGLIEPLHDGPNPKLGSESHLRQPSVGRPFAGGSRPTQAPSYSQMRPPSAAIPRPALPGASRYQSSQTPRSPALTNRDYASLLAHIEDLKSRLNTKDGEIQIVRKRLDQDRQDHERDLQTLRKQTSEQITRQERAVEAAEVAQRKATTELEFARQDLKEEVDRAKRKEKDGHGGTPRKSAATKIWGVSDGFEDVEMAASPSKGARGKPAASAVPEHPARLTRTPTKSKRKRPTIESPIMALETTDDVVMQDDTTTAPDHLQRSTGGVQQQARGTPGFDFIKVMLNHSAGRGRPLAFEYLSGFSLASRPGESLAATIFKKMAVMGHTDKPARLPIEFCELLIELWDHCFKEKCLEPITELISLISFTLQLHTVAVAPFIAQSLLPIATSSCYEVAIPRFHNTNPAGDPTDDNWKNFSAHIATTDVLSLLYLTALGCSTSTPADAGVTVPIVDFWSSVHPEFVLMMLTHKQPVADFVTVLRLLQTSVFDNSIGPIAPERKTPEQIASHIIERISFSLVEMPRWDIDRDKLRSVRREILQTLAAFARSAFGVRSLAVHDYAIPRLVVFLSSLIDELYDGQEACQYSLPTFREDIDPPTAVNFEAEGLTPDQLQVLISNTMLLLHAIVTNKANKDRVSVPTKLAKFTGTSQKYLLSLARLNFADIEDGVTEETAELAHELLELAVTEDEGPELGEFFGG